MGTRKTVTFEELEEWFRKRLKERFGISPEDFEIGTPNLYQDPDETGCNWTVQIFRGHGTDPKAYFPEAVEVVKEARRLFNLTREGERKT